MDTVNKKYKLSLVEFWSARGVVPGEVVNTV